MAGPRASVTASPRIMWVRVFEPAGRARYRKTFSRRGTATRRVSRGSRKGASLIFAAKAP